MDKELTPHVPTAELAMSQAGPNEHPLIFLQRTVGNHAVNQWLHPQSAQRPARRFPKWWMAAAPALLVAAVSAVYAWFAWYRFGLK
jgi:hypothetical protein